MPSGVGSRFRASAEAAQQQLSHGWRGRERQRQRAVARELGFVTATTVQLGEHRRPHMRALEPGGRLEAVQQREPGVRTLGLGDGHRAVQSVQRRGLQALERGIQLGDGVPARLLERRGEAVLGRDRCLGVIARETVARRRALEPLHAGCDLLRIPLRSVLLLEQHQRPVCISPATQASRMQVHQRDEGGRWWGLPRGVLGEDQPEPQRLRTQLLTDRQLGMRRQVPLGEELIQDPQHGGHARLELRGGEPVELRWLLAQALAGPGEALVDVGLGDEQAAADLGHTEPAQGLEREHQLGAGRQHVVTAHEEHAREVIGQLARQRWLGRGAALGPGIEPMAPASEDALPPRAFAQLGDQMIVGDPKQPRRRGIGLPLDPPVLERPHQGHLRRVFDRVQVLDPHAA